MFDKDKPQPSAHTNAKPKQTSPKPQNPKTPQI
jgi:hypothetical protein